MRIVACKRVTPSECIDAEAKTVRYGSNLSPFTKKILGFECAVCRSFHSLINRPFIGSYFGSLPLPLLRG